MPGPSSAASWDLKTGTVSMHPGSATGYARGHIRGIGSGKVRLQGSYQGHTWEEVAGPLSSKLVEYIKACPHTTFSIAGSGTTYVPCLMRKEPGKLGKVRVQIAGPEYNRPWGVEFVIPAPTVYHRVPGATFATAPTESPDELPVGGGFVVGDKVTIAIQGDADGCGGGPKVGVECTVVDVKTIMVPYSCGPISVKPLDPKWHGGKWATTAAHLTKVAKPPVDEETGIHGLGNQLAYLKKFGTKFPTMKDSCIVCGHGWGKHIDAACPMPAIKLTPPSWHGTETDGKVPF